MWVLSLSLDTHTHTLTPSGDSNLRAIFRPDDWQLDACSSPSRRLIPPAIPSHAISSLSSLSVSHSQHFSGCDSLTSPLATLIPLSILLPPSLLSLRACCGAITMTEAIRDIYHMGGGVSERKPSTGLQGGTHTHTCTDIQHGDKHKHIPPSPPCT